MKILSLACLLSMATISQAALWSPMDTTTVAWYDAADSDNVVLSSGTNVASWNDISGNGYHMDVVGGNHPDYGPSYQIDGKNVISFTNTFDELVRSGIPDINLSQLTVISVGMPKADGNYPNLGSVYSTDLSDKLFLRLQNDGTQGKISSGLKLDGTNVAIGTSNSPLIVDDTPVMLSAYYDGLNGVARLNGGALSQTVDVADGATFTINEIQVGRDSNTPKNWQAEMVVLGTSDFETIEKVEGYLAWKWGMEDALAADHTYKLAAPVVIPEPSSLALLGLCTLGLLFRRRRK